MNGTELRSFSHFQIDFVHCKAVKVSQNDQIQMER